LGGDQFADSGLRSKLAAGRSFFLPLHYTPSYQYPLIVWFHSNGFNEHQIDRVMPHISVRNHIGIGVRGTRAADTMGHRFDWHDSPAAIVAAHDATCEAVEEAMRRFSIHPSRIVLAGYREGGTMAQRIALRDPEKFAGVVSLGGRIPQGGMRNLSALRHRRMPMLWQWGQDNAQYTQENLKSDCRLSMSIGAEVEIRQYLDDDEMNTVVLGDVDEWIMRRIVAGSSIADSQQWATNPVAYSNN
jgi:phospholipase/carboxylesterase